MTKQGIAMTIDFSEVENGMNIIHSMAHALMDSSLHSQSLTLLSRKGESYFNKYADAAGHSIAHMYEWDQAGSPTSRLFRMEWKGSGRSRDGQILWMPSKSQVPISTSHQLAAMDAGVVLSRFIWESKAYQLETKTTFVITPMGSRDRRDGWKRIPGSHAPAKKLMVKTRSPMPRGAGPNKDIIFVKKSRKTYEYAGRFTNVFVTFWNENNFRIAVFYKFERLFFANVERTFSREIMNAKARRPVVSPMPGINIFSNGKRGMGHVGGRPVGALVRRYSAALRKGMARERF